MIDQSSYGRIPWPHEFSVFTVDLCERWIARGKEMLLLDALADKETNFIDACGVLKWEIRLARLLAAAPTASPATPHPGPEGADSMNNDLTAYESYNGPSLPSSSMDMAWEPYHYKRITPTLCRHWIAHCEGKIAIILLAGNSRHASIVANIMNAWQAELANLEKPEQAAP
jgi:hypothetical protein